MDEKVLTYGVTVSRKIGDAKEIYIEEFERNGFTIIKNLISEKDINFFSNRLDELYQLQCQEIGGEKNLEKINDASIVRAPLCYEERFLELAAHPLVMELVRNILGESFVLSMQNGIINQPADYQHQTLWHRDLNYQHWISSRPIALNVLFCLDPFRLETGATHVLPASHLIEEFPSEQFVRKNQVPVEAEPGSAILMNAMTYHRAGYNVSKNLRRAVNHVIGLPFISQQINLTNMLDRKWAEDLFLSSYLGFRWSPADNVLSWRENKINNNVKKNEYI